MTTHMPIREARAVADEVAEHKYVPSSQKHDAFAALHCNWQRSGNEGDHKRALSIWRSGRNYA